MKSHIDKFIIIDKLSDLNKRSMILGHHITRNIICSKLGVHRSLPSGSMLKLIFKERIIVRQEKRRQKGLPNIRNSMCTEPMWGKRTALRTRLGEGIVSRESAETGSDNNTLVL